LTDFHNSFTDTFSRILAIKLLIKIPPQLNIQPMNSVDLEKFCHNCNVLIAINKTIYTLLHTDNHARTSSLTFLQAICSSWHPTNSVKAHYITKFLLGSYSPITAAGS